MKINKEIPLTKAFFLMNLKQDFFIAFLLWVPAKPIKIYIFCAIKYYDDDSKNLLFYASITFFYFYFILFDVSLYSLDLQQNKRQWAHKIWEKRGGRMGKEQQSQFHSLFFCMQLFLLNHALYAVIARNFSFQ